MWQKLSREKTFAIFAVLWLNAKVFSVKFGDVVSFGTAKASNPRKFSPRKWYYSPICESILPRKFPAIRYRGCRDLSLKTTPNSRAWFLNGKFLATMVFILPHWSMRHTSSIVTTFNPATTYSSGLSSPHVRLDLLPWMRSQRYSCYCDHIALFSGSP